MSHITGNLNLSKLQSAVMKIKGKTGNMVDCVVIPIDANNLYRHKSGVFFNFIAFEMNNTQPNSKNTHIVKQSLPKSVFDKFTEEQKKAQPIIGNLTVSGLSQQNSNSGFVPEQSEDSEEELPF